MKKQEIVDELSRLYRLQDEGVYGLKHLIAELEDLLCSACDDELDAKAAHAKNPKNRKEVSHGR